MSFIRRLLVLAAGLAALLPAPFPLSAQETDTLSAEDLVLELLEAVDPEFETQDEFVEEVTELIAHPLDVNTASEGEIARIPFVERPLSRKLVEARAEEGPFATLEEAFEAAGLDSETARRLRPFLHAVRPQTAPLLEVGEVSAQFIHRLTRRLDLGPGFNDDTTRTSYLGRPERYYTRLQVRAGPQIVGTVALDNRPGEPFVWDPATNSYGMNHVAGHLALREVGPLETLLLGDYTLLFGQGLALWRPTAFGKGRETVRPASRRQSRIAPYASTGRSRFFRGAAMTLRLSPRLTLTGFASRKAIDAVLEEAPEESTGYRIEAFPSSELHRTASERERKAASRAQTLGGAATYSGERAELGITALHTGFEHPVAPPDTPYQMFDFSGAAAHVVSAFGAVDLSGAHLFTESARDHRGRIGMIAGLEGALGEGGRAVVAARRFPRDFVSLHGAAFGERSGPPVNETGIYLGTDLRLHPAWRLAGYFDQFRFPWARFGAERPSGGFDALLLVEYRPRPGLTVYAQARSKTREEGHVVESAGAPAPVAGVSEETRQSARLHLSYRLTAALRFQSRLELTRFLDGSGTPSHGNLLYQDVRWVPVSALQLDGRLTFFEAEHFGARLYAYENDLFYTFSVPMLSGVGQRAYLMARWSPRGALTIEVKLAETRLENTETIGSGLDEVEGNRLREVRAQLRWRF